MVANSFNKFLNKHYNYNYNSEQEIRSHIYKNRLTNDLSGLVTIAKNTLLRLKFKLELKVFSGNITLIVTPVYFEESTPELIECLEANLIKNLTSETIIINPPEEIPETVFRNIRSIEL